MLGSALFVFILFSRFGQAVLCAVVAGIQAGHALRGGRSRGGGGFRLGWGTAADVVCPYGDGCMEVAEAATDVGGGAFDDRDEQAVTSPLPHTSLSRHVSFSARSIWWPGAPADPPCASKAGTGSAA